MHQRCVRVLLCCCLLALGACATLAAQDPLQVTVAGIEAMPGAGESLEVRFLVKLRVQNPNDTSVDYDGVAVNMDVQGRSFASGVSDVAGTVPSLARP